MKEKEHIPEVANRRRMNLLKCNEMEERMILKSEREQKRRSITVQAAVCVMCSPY